MLIDSKGYHTFFNAKRNLMAKFYDTLRLVLNCPVISKELWCLLMLLGNKLIAVMLVRYLAVFISIYSTTNNQLNSGNGGIQKLRYFLHAFSIPGVLQVLAHNSMKGRSRKVSYKGPLTSDL